MTDDLRDQHLDDEAISAVLDGEADVDEAAHADACDACRARLAALRDVSVLLAAPVPPADTARRESAISAAISAADDRGGAVVPLHRRRTPPAWLAAAAAVVVAVGAIALLPRSGDDDADTAAGRDEATQDTVASDGDEFASEMAATPPMVDGGDLGEVDPATLQERIEGSFGAQRSGDAVQEDAALEAEVPCETIVRDGNDELGPLVYRATGTVEAEPVVVLAFDVPPDRWVYVVTVDGCAIRNQQTYSP